MVVKWTPISRVGQFERELLGDNRFVNIVYQINAKPHVEWLEIFEASNKKFDIEEDFRRSSPNIVRFQSTVAEVAQDTKALDELLLQCNEQFKNVAIPRIEADFAAASEQDEVAARKRAEAEAELDRLALELDAGNSEQSDRPGTVIRAPGRTTPER